MTVKNKFRVHLNFCTAVAAYINGGIESTFMSHNVMEKSRKICSIYDQRAITDHRQVQNWFTKFYSGKISSEDEPRQGYSLDVDEESLKSLVESNLQENTWELAKILNTSQSTIYQHLQKTGKISKLGVWIPHILRG